MASIDDRQAGLSRRKLMITMSVLSVGLLGTAAGLLHDQALSRATGDRDVPKTSIRNTIEELRAEDSDTITEPVGNSRRLWIDRTGESSHPRLDPCSATDLVDAFTDESDLAEEYFHTSGSFDLEGDGAISNGPCRESHVFPTRLTFTQADDPEQVAIVPLLRSEDGVR